MTLADQINQVLRRVVSTGEQDVVVVEQEFPVDAAALWSACTEPERLGRWFEPVSGDLRAGGRYRLEDSGTEGVVEHCEPPTGMRITWEYEGDVSRVSVTLTPSGPEATVLRLEHAAAPGEHWAEYGPAAGGTGWDVSLLALALHLEGKAADVEKLLATDEGRRFTADVISCWRAAHVDSGADPAVARAAAERSHGFYLPG